MLAMKSRQVVKVMTLSMAPKGWTSIRDYLDYCRVKNGLIEGETSSMPPTPHEAAWLMTYLRQRHVNPKVVGGVAVVGHMAKLNRKDVRPTYDLDVWVDRVPSNPPEGWRRDPASVGVTSWISPSGGTVDFLTPGHEYVHGKNPSKIDLDTSILSFPVATWQDLMRMKLMAMRSKDIPDLVALYRVGVSRLGRNVTLTDIGLKVRGDEADNFDLIQRLYQAEPEANYRRWVAPD